MEKQLFAGENPEERRRYLEDSAYKVAREDYYQELTPEERIEAQEKLTQLQGDIISAEEEKSEVTKQYSQEIKKLKKENLELVKELSANMREVTGDVYYLADEANRMMGIYNDRGRLLRSRPMTQDELQKSIFPLKKAQ